MEDTVRVNMAEHSEALSVGFEQDSFRNSNPFCPKPSLFWNFNGGFVAFVVVVVLLLTCTVFTLLDRGSCNERIELLEAEVHRHEALIIELRDSLKYLARRDHQPDLRDVTDEHGTAPDGRGPATTLQDKPSISRLREDSRRVPERLEVTGSDSTVHHLTNDAVPPKIGKEQEDVPAAKKFSREQTSQDERTVRRAIRAATRTAEPHSTQPRRGRDRSGRGDRPRNRKSRVNETTTPEANHERNNGVGEPRLLAHFVPRKLPQFQGPQFINATNAILGNWMHADWMGHNGIGHEGFVVKRRGHQARAQIEVEHSGIYYVYSQVSFADNNYLLGHSVMVDENAMFICTLWALNDLINANTCRTGGLLHIRAGQHVYIKLIESDLVINADQENTFFGLMMMMPLPDPQPESAPQEERTHAEERHGDSVSSPPRTQRTGRS